MTNIFSHKLFEIFFEKGLIALLILLASSQVNLSLERYKLVETQRVAGTTEFVSACQEIWSKVYEYEAAVNAETSATVNRLHLRIAGAKMQNADDLEVADLKSKEEKKIKEIEQLVGEQKFVIGQQFSDHFFKYLGLVRARADAEKTAWEKSGEEAKISRDAGEVFDKQIASMRFTSDMAREYAIAQLPH
ncbi:MAG: hypothetical protein JWN23_993 [Rhodocyclales bacterium]|nr:hypothetical protein [Rhodocyclales bacterium]